MENEKVCRNCEHACHCDTVVCQGEITAGMTGKVTDCGCSACNCGE